MDYETGKNPTVPLPMSATAVFNGYVGANLIFAYDRIGLFKVLGPKQRMSFRQLASQIQCITNRFEALLNAGITFGFITKCDDGLYAWTEAGQDMCKHVGYFTWSVGGYGNFFRELGTLVDNKECWSGLRDGSMVALGSDQANASFMREIFYSALDNIKFSRIADFGCGNAGRLIDVCKRYENMSGVGVDIDLNAVQLARKNVKNNGLQDSIDLYCEDVLIAIEDPMLKAKLADVEVVTSFMMLHDLLNMEGLKDVLFDRLRMAFPSVKYFIIADTVRMASPEGLNELPIFNIGFELLHGYMDVQIHDKESYDHVFEKSGLTIEKCIPFGTPNTYLYVLKV
ncbi:methyltransferase [Shewanella sp. WE21]|uniref:methyltransferase n=1 Tax=Shewanella sp. WE21 TaxID=2029986 RepID=UPI001C1F7FBB|nr:methyltransferase [Shewanella sp. WE21]